MSDISRSTPPADASEDITSDRVNSNAGGNALLDAQRAVSEQPVPNLSKDEIATNFSDNEAMRKPADGKTMTTTGAYPANQSQFEKADYPSPTVREEDPDV